MVVEFKLSGLVAAKVGLKEALTKRFANFNSLYRNKTWHQISANFQLGRGQHRIPSKGTPEVDLRKFDNPLQKCYDPELRNNEFTADFPKVPHS